MTTRFPVKHQTISRGRKISVSSPNPFFQINPKAVICFQEFWCVQGERTRATWQPLPHLSGTGHEPYEHVGDDLTCHPHYLGCKKWSVRYWVIPHGIQQSYLYRHPPHYRVKSFRNVNKCSINKHQGIHNLLWVHPGDCTTVTQIFTQNLTSSMWESPTGNKNLC